MKSNNSYPRFYLNSNNLIAILKPDRMFHLKRGGHGKGDGFEFRIYITRAMVLKYGSGTEISFEEFKNNLGTVFAEYINELTSLLPQSYLVEGKPQNLLQ